MTSLRRTSWTVSSFGDPLASTLYNTMFTRETQDSRKSSPGGVSCSALRNPCRVRQRDLLVWAWIRRRVLQNFCPRSREQMGERHIPTARFCQDLGPVSGTFENKSAMKINLTGIQWIDDVLQNLSLLTMFGNSRRRSASESPFIAQ